MTQSKEAQQLKPKPVGKSREEFRRLHDRSFIVPTRITAASKALGKVGWVYESEFIKLACISQTDIGAYRDGFSDYIVETKGHNSKRAWCGSKELATEFREMG